MLMKVGEYYELGPAASTLVRLVDTVAGESVPAVCGSRDRAFSAINGNGVPIQFSVSLGTQVPTLRVLSEVGRPGMSMPERLAASCLRLREILQLLDLKTSSPAVNHAFAALLPDNPRHTDGWTGGIWIAFGATRDRPITLRLYLNQRWGDIVERYQRLARFLVDLGRAHALEQWIDIAPSISTCSVPYGIAFDVTSEGVGRFKVYFACIESRRRYWLELFDLLGLADRFAQMERLISICGLSLDEMAPGTILPSVELDDKTSRQAGLKVDLSCNHLRTSDVEMDQRITEYVRACDLDPSEYRDVAGIVARRPLREDGIALIQYCGVGFAGPDNTRVNVYLCPELTDPLDWS
jgi:hypothetical protein